MSQHYEYPLPPPPRAPATGAAFGSGSGSGSLASRYVPEEVPARRRLLPTAVPAITTDLLTTQGHVSQTPISATVLSTGALHPYTPGTPVAFQSRSPSPLAQQASTPRTPTMEPYNPRQWSNRGTVSGAQMVFQQRGGAAGPSSAAPSTMQSTGMEASMPSPPPPYSPTNPEHATSRPIVPSPVLDNIGFTASPLAERSVTNSPRIPMSPSFPPPPPQNSRPRERSASGLAGQMSFFSLANLRGKQPANAETNGQPQIPQASRTVHLTHFDDNRPPAARRAASTGHIQSGGATSSALVAGPSSGRGSPENQWQPGMPLPGPPPGPPPAGARSQSENRSLGASASSSMTTDRMNDTRRRRTMAPSSLGPVPPTPADFVDQGVQTGAPDVPQVPAQSIALARDTAVTRPLHIDTHSSRESSLARRPAQRDISAGIRERRSRSRAAKGSMDIMSPADDDSRPGNLVFSTGGGSISRRREHMRAASGQNYAVAGPSTYTERQPSSQPSSAKKPNETVLTPPYTPASGKKAGLRAPGSASSDRPISHLLHAPNEESTSMPAPLSPKRPPSNGSIKTSTRLDTFALQAIERHRHFVEREAAAVTDEERLELLAKFMVHESRLRRDRYTSAYNAMAGEIVDLTRDMWRSYATTSRRAATPSTSMSSFDPTVPSWASDGHPTSAHGNVPSSASSLGEFTPGTDAASMGDPNETLERLDTRQWPEAFKPSLSPIPSMAVSTVPDEGSSRGRTASRWWEQSNSGSGSIGKPDRMEKSRRETKYMGVSVATLQASDEALADIDQRQPTPDSGQQTFLYGPDEYPPEKVGWHEGTEFSTPVATPQRIIEHKASSSTPGVAPMDVSRLVTLPPPYPRHHPAVNNNHPQLADIRATHRILADHCDVQKIKDSYLDQDFTAIREQQEAAKQRRVKLRADIQSQIADGTMSFADAAKSESEFDAQEAERGKTNARANFDMFERTVSHPLNALLTERLGKANTCIKQLREDLDSGQESSDPNRAQEEGDEHPERLEKLTMLKWLFEAREQLHKEMFDFHAMRADKYSEVILTPYRIAKAQTKIDEATNFFKKDNTERQISFAKDALQRFEELQTIIDKNVSRGVENQLSAFWDIAPALLEVTQHIPTEMATFEVEIPLQEYDENPSYHDHPLQYLYSLLNHAEKSAYQFIESQINLLCLLHEVRTATTKSSLRLVEIERNAASPADEEIRAEMDQARREAEAHLTRDLKDKVGEVERQWKEALGDGIGACKERVKNWLEESGGLEDLLE